MRIGSLARDLAATPGLDAAALGWLFCALLAIEEGRDPAPADPPPAIAAAWPAVAEQQRSLHDAAEATRKARARAGRLGGQRKAANARKAARALAASLACAPARAQNHGVQGDVYHPETGDIGGKIQIGGSGERQREGEVRGGVLANARQAPVDNSRRITDYGQIFDIGTAPAIVAITVTGERMTPAAVAAYSHFASLLGETRFRSIVARFWGEGRQGEFANVENTAAVLVSRLKAALS